MTKYGPREVDAALKRLKKDLSKSITVEKALLFGSRARGDWLYTSDVDMMLVSPDFEGRKPQDRAAEVLAHWDEGVDLEVLCYTPKELERMSGRMGIVRQALKEGIAL